MLKIRPAKTSLQTVILPWHFTTTGCRIWTFACPGILTSYGHPNRRKKRCRLFPGCQLSASSPGLVRHAYEYLTAAADNPALYLGCCGIPAEWAGDTARRQEVTDRICAEWEHLGRPLFVLACTACQVNLKQYCPEIQTISLYRYMDMYPEHLPCRQ